MDNACKFITKPKRNIKIGDLNEPISILTRIKKAPNTDIQDIIIDQETLIAEAWALRVSVNGEDIFNGINLLGKVSDHFYIRYNSTIAIKSENIIVCKGKTYRVLEVLQDLHGEGIFSLIKTRAS